MYWPPKRLRPHFEKLTSLIKENKLAEASEYLYNLPPDVYDEIIERAYVGGSFQQIVNKIEGLITVKKNNELFKLNSHEGDDNFIF
jgi:predicted metal-dependent hydrolase